MDKLIEKVKQHDVLFNMGAMHYRDPLIRQEAWEAIGKDLNIEAEKAKTDWDKLRRCYSNALNRRRWSSKIVAPWKYEKEMSFLLPFVENRKKQKRLAEFSNEDPLTPIEEYEMKIELEQEEILDFDNQINSFEMVTQNLESMKQAQSVDHPEYDEQLKTNMEHSSDLIRQSQEYSNINNIDESDLFYLSMSRMAKRLPKVDQAKIKLMLSQTVLEAEIKNLENK